MTRWLDDPMPHGRIIGTMADEPDTRSPDINMSRINPAGIGGLGLVAGVLVLAYNLPEARTFLIIALIGGIALSVPLYYWRKNHQGKR